MIPRNLSIRADMPIFCGDQATTHLIQYCRSHQLDRFLLVADQNTYPALGQSVEASLKAHGRDVRTMILNAGEVVADERRVFDVLFGAGGEKLVYLAVGSGTITDIVRYASFSARNPFISLPTAPSVDAYASGGAALVMGGYKLTVPAQAPLAILADLPTLCTAPQAMISAGFGDMLGKYTSLADWRLGVLLLDEPYDADIAARSMRALLACVATAPEIGRGTGAGVATLMEGLLESGLCMMDFGSSRPASGAEHLFSHFWEIQLALTEQPSVLHGAKVGVGTVLAARRYAAIRSLTRQQAVERISRAARTSVADEIVHMREDFGPVAERIVANHRPFLEKLEAELPALQQKIGDLWDDIQEIANSVPPAHEIANLLKQAGGPSEPQALGLGDDHIQQALRSARYMRARFTVDTLGRLLQLW